MLEQILEIAAKYGGSGLAGFVVCYIILSWLSKQGITIQIGKNGKVPAHPVAPAPAPPTPTNGNGKVEWEKLTQHCLIMHEPMWNDIKENTKILGRIEQKVKKL